MIATGGDDNSIKIIRQDVDGTMSMIFSATDAHSSSIKGYFLFIILRSALDR